MSGWNPALYSRFEAERTRPARELLARVPEITVRRAVDLGCGPGNSTELLVRRWPDAHVTGIDNSEAMLASARKRLPQVPFELADIAGWQPAQAPDLVYANAALQWLPDHATLLPRLLALLAPGGVLALQMPDNLDEPSHALMRDVASQAPWAAAIGDAGSARTRLLAPAQIYDLLARDAEVDVWHTIYQHVLASPAAIVDWLRGTGLRPFLDPLAPAQQAGFLAAYEARIQTAYPARTDGTRLLAFPRCCVVARRRS